MNRSSLVLIAGVLMFSCGGNDATGLTLEILADPAFEIDRYQIKLGDRVGIAEVASSVDVVTAHEMGGMTVELEVWGLAGTLQRAYGATEVTLESHKMRTYVIELEGVNCTDMCEPYAVRCMGDGISTCQAVGDGCFAWGPVAACPSGTPFCSNGQCSDTCIDECTAGESACSGSLADKTCGDFDSDECLEWSTPTACGSGETCNGTSCETAGCEETGCSAPPPTTCTSMTTVLAYDEGTCEANGTCSYEATEHTCDIYGCTGGQCRCACSRAQTCCEKIAAENGTDPIQCRTWGITCALEGPDDNTTGEANAMIRLYCPEYTCWRDDP